MKLSLCLLTWNELGGCQHDVPLLPREHFDEIYATDGGSKDGTVEYLESQNIPVYQQDKPGYNQAYLSAFRRCTTDALVLFHPKGSIDPTSVLQFRPYLDQGYDLVIASRLMKGAVNEEDSRFLKPRKWFVLVMATISAILWRREGNIAWDVFHGMRAMRRDAFDVIEPLQTGQAIDLEMVVRSYRKRLKRIEFPVHEKPRMFGETHFKAIPSGLRLLPYLVQELRRAA